MYSQNELNHIRWQCRRGMKELDLLIEPFFDEDFSKLSEKEQQVFVRFLEESDLKLFRWLLRGEIPADPEYVALVEVILKCHRERSGI